jgi:hypothetical protein
MQTNTPCFESVRHGVLRSPGDLESASRRRIARRELRIHDVTGKLNSARRDLVEAVKLGLTPRKIRNLEIKVANWSRRLTSWSPSR